MSVSTTSPLLRSPGFLTVWGVGALNSTGRWLEMLVFAVFVLDVTGSPLLVASMLMLRLLPMALFGLFGGILAARFPRWQILRLGSATTAAMGLGLAALAYTETLSVWHCGAAAFISGLVWCTDFPVRRTLMGDIAGTERIGRAMSLDILAGSVTRMLGPLLGGILYQEIGLSGAFLLGAALYVVGLLALMIIAVPETNPPSAESIVANLRTGLRLVKDNHVLQGILGITVVFNLWGFPFVSMVPVFGKEVLSLNDALTGLLTSAEGAGSLAGALLLATFSTTQQARYIYVISVLSYCAFCLLFAQSNAAWITGTLLLFVGLVSAGFGAMQSALILINSPQDYQRQMMGVLSLCIGTAPLGFLHIGMLADWLGVAMACTITALEGLLAMGLVLWWRPALLSRQPTTSAA
ncbi:MAG: MFS transporter [Pseudomonadota bacterium]